MAIKIKNLRISPYTDKNELKVIFGDEMHLTFEIPHVVGESYLCALDNERILYPINRPVCAYTNVFTRNEGEVSFTLKLTTSKLRDYVSSIRKPMPVWLQIVREVNGKYETVLLDDILAIPSVIDGNMTVYEGDSFKELLDGKMDVPEAQGTAGQVLTLDADGHYAWADLPEIPEQVQADWDESDSSDVSYIRNKPTLFSGDYNDLTNKPNLATVATSGDYNDLTNKPIITAPVNADWDESDSSDLAYILNKPALATVATSGSYNDLTDKPEIPEQVQADWDESDSSAVDYIKNKPVIPAAQVQSDWDESDSSDVSFIRNKPDLAVDENDYLCFTALAANSTISMRRSKSRSGNNPEDKDIEYSTDKKTWSQYQWDNQWNVQAFIPTDSGTVITLTNVGDKVWFRGNNARWNYQTEIGIGAYIAYKFYFVMSGTIGASGDVVYLASKKGDVKKAINLSNLFQNCTSLVTPPKLGFTELLEDCYNSLFIGCTNLNEVPELKAIKMEKSCYYALFSGCTSLQYPPVLPSVQLAEKCYGYLFRNCTSLKLAPELPASNLVSQCYNSIFEGCTLIDHLKVGFSDWAITGSVESSYKTYNWLSNVSATGVFECPAMLDTSTRDASHIPSGWSVVWTTSVQSDWDESDSTEASFIKNKPAIPTTSDINALIADALTIHNS